VGKLEFPNLIYPVGDPIFIHIYREKGKGVEYHVIEPQLNEKEKRIYDDIVEKLLDKAYKEPVPDKSLKLKTVLLKLYEDFVHVEGSEKGAGIDKIPVTVKEYKKIKYFILRDRIGYGKLEPLFYDTNLEDIHCTGVGDLSSVHKVFGMVHTILISRRMTN
jgi:flagellar protein FlaI